MTNPANDQPTPHTTAEEDAEEAPRVEDALAVDSLPDEVRTHTDPSETEQVQRNSGELEPVEDAAADPLIDDETD